MQADGIPLAGQYLRALHRYYGASRRFGGRLSLPPRSGSWNVWLGRWLYSYLMDTFNAAPDQLNNKILASRLFFQALGCSPEARAASNSSPIFLNEQTSSITVL